MALLKYHQSHYNIISSLFNIILNYDKLAKIKIKTLLKNQEGGFIN